MRISIPTRIIKAAIQCAAAKDVRYCLVGIHIRLTEQQMIVVESTDGTIAFQDRLHELHDAADCKGPCSWIIPLDAAKTAAKSKAGMLDLVDMPDGRYCLGDTVFACIDGKFPDVDRVMPKKQKIDTCRPQDMQFNPELLMRCTEAMRLATGARKTDFFFVQSPYDGQSVGAALMHTQTADYPRCAIMPINARAFTV